jgi:hypothetical protein
VNTVAFSPDGRHVLVTLLKSERAPMTGVAERKEIARALREYCALDTYAMYAIWRVLWDTVGEVPAARATAQG